ncbi:prolipoprotein diacylglyceryl transferase [Mycoplasma corogypsi]|uniref:prolipoprotein diacylglyceryl transferase n=1 Tax=Mycoplasma corogypsi TaxID=2106 RepID=UPI0038733247
MINAQPAWVPETAIAAGLGTDLFKIGNFEFRVYSFTMMLGFLCSILTIFYFWYRAGYKTETLLTLIIITIPSSIMGARLGFLAERIIADGSLPARWWAIWEGGLSIQGGVLLALICDLIYGYVKRNEIDVRLAASLIIPTVLIGQVAGRWGNFANHEVYGKIDWSGQSVLIFGKAFASQMYISDATSNAYGLVGAYRYPLFLYEGIANLLGYLIIVWVLNFFGLTKPGTTAGLYLVWYGTVRLAMEPLREESYVFYTVLSAMFVAIGFIAFVYYQFFGAVKYIRFKEKYYYVYKYAQPEAYASHVNVTSITYLYKKLYSKLLIKKA